MEAPVFDIAHCVDQFIWCRDEIERREKAFKLSLAKIKEYKDKLEGAIGTHLTRSGAESIKTANGTCFLSSKSSATIGDKQIFKDYVVQHQQFDLIDWKANATAVKDYIKEHDGMLPPGVNFSTEQTIRVNRPRGGKSEE